MDTGFVTVVVEATGRKQRVPAHYLDNPVLSRGIELPPSARAGSDAPATAGPSDAWTRPQLDEHATGLGIDLAGLRSKGDVLDAIAAHHESPNPNPGEGGAPDAGDTTNPDTAS